MTRNPALHRAPLGYGKNGPLTWVAECRVPWAPPSAERLTMAEWMIDHGSDVHQGGEGPLMRDRKSTRLNLQSLTNLVCRLLLEKKKNEHLRSIISRLDIIAQR